MIIESLVAVLLILTICYCMLLNKHLKRLRADEHSLKAMISELITATEIAERAIGGLKATVRDCDTNLGGQLSMAGELCDRLKLQTEQGESVLTRISRITAAARPRVEVQPAPEQDVHSVLAAAQAFDERARNRIIGQAA
jgi:preprotein translocase subunit YajC